jgi:hypothetical protein
MKKSCASLITLVCAMFMAVSCLSPQDPSAYTDEESLKHDSEVIDEFVKKEKDNTETKQQDSNSGPHYEARVFQLESPGVGFGYNIIKDGILKIQQTSIPSIEGTDGFSSKEKAGKAADFVIHKMKNNLFPPSVTRSELDSLGVLN